MRTSMRRAAPGALVDGRRCRRSRQARSRSPSRPNEPGLRGSCGAKPRAVVAARASDQRRRRRARCATSTCVASACFAMLVSDSCTMRKTAVACARRAVEVAGSLDRELARHAGALREVLHQPLDRGDEAQVVEHQRAQVGGDAPRRRHGGLEQRLHPRRACAANSGCAAPALRRSQATSIFSAVSAWPSSSCSSRAMRLFSCSRAVCGGGAELLQLLLRARAAPRRRCTRSVTSRRITV